MFDLRKSRRLISLTAFIVIIIMTVSNTTKAFANDPKIKDRDIHCPPSSKEQVDLVPEDGLDIYIPGNPPLVRGWLNRRYHRDDHEGNDLTVDTICILGINYYTIRIIQSKNGTETTLVAPFPGPGVEDAGECCPYLNASDKGPLFENPDSAINNSEEVPRLVTFIAKNPHLPYFPDNMRTEDYQKTLLWLFPGRVVKGTIVQDISGNIGYCGEFSTPRTPGGKNGKDLDDTEKVNLLALLRQEEFLADEVEKTKFPNLEKRKLEKRERDARNHILPLPSPPPGDDPCAHR